jgi:Fe-S-cluster containining protein
MNDKPINRPVEYEGAEEILQGRFEGAPYESPVQPTQLTLENNFQFRCYPGIACFNECCRNIDILITPYDILRLKKRLGITSSEFVARHTLPFEMDHHSMPGLKMLTKPESTECVFLTEEGCSVYEDRPAACRYYALGSMGVRKKDASQVEEVYFVVKEPHCLGHNEPQTQTVGEYRKDQGVDRYDEMNHLWRDIIIKKRSSGPTVGKPSERSMQLFDMCSYDVDSFRDFIQSEGFQDIFDVEADTLRQLLSDDEELLQFAFRFLEQVLFGVENIPVKAGAKEKRLEKRRTVLDERRRKEVEEHKAHDPRDDAT